MSSNRNLHSAKRARNDEFYTRYEDIEKELTHYTDQLEGLYVYMPCDSEESCFWKYFTDNYDAFKLRHITATCYVPGGNGQRIDYDGDKITRTTLDGDGDFRSGECTAIKDECDIVITNPPFSLFRDFIKWLE